MRVLDFPYQSTTFCDWFNGHSGFHSAKFKSYIKWVSLRLLSSTFYFSNLDTEGTFACYHLTCYLCQKVKRMLVTPASCEHIKHPLFYVIPTIIYNRSLFWSCLTVKDVDTWYGSNSLLNQLYKDIPQCFVKVLSSWVCDGWFRWVVRPIKARVNKVLVKEIKLTSILSEFQK